MSTLYRGRKIENDDVSFEDTFISIKYTIQFSLAMHYKRSLTSKWWQIDTYVTVIDLKIKCSDWEGKGPCAIVPLTWKMAHQSLCRMIRNGPWKSSKSLKKAENGPFGKNLFPFTVSVSK